MIYLWDTNIIIHRLRRSSLYQSLNEKHSFFRNGNQVVISIVSVGEIYSLAYQRRWQTQKLDKLSQVLHQIRALPIARQRIVDAYAYIDAYSQGNDPDRTLPNGMSARNMGKNDLWIAATTNEIGANLVTTDKDFDHLNEVFFSVITN